jgi:hypothetical protein
MQKYIETTEEQLLRLRDSLELLGQLDQSKVKDLDLCIYGMTRNQSIIDAAREAIAEETYDENITEADVTLSEVAVAIPISADTIYALTGNGIKVGHGETFTYLGESEGPKTASFGSASFKPTISLHDLEDICLADSDGWSFEYLQKHSAGGGAKVQKKVRRNEEATQLGVPTPAAPVAPQPAAAPQQKRTSLQLESLVERFLG